MLKSKLKKTLQKLLFLFIISLVYSGVGCILAIIISNRFGYNLQDVMFYVGFIIFFIGILMSMKGNPSGISISETGSKNANMVSYFNTEITRQEREINPYYKDYFKNNVVDFSFNRLTFIIGGIFTIVFAIIFF